MSARRRGQPARPRRPASRPLAVRLAFVGNAAELIRMLLARGLDGPTPERVVEGLALAELRRRIEESVRSCRMCGCTDAHACEGGCSWVEPDLCSECAPLVETAIAIKERSGKRSRAPKGRK